MNKESKFDNARKTRQVRRDTTSILGTFKKSLVKNITWKLDTILGDMTYLGTSIDHDNNRQFDINITSG